MSDSPEAAPTSFRRVVAGVAATQLATWGVLYYTFAVVLVPMREDLGYGTAQLTGAYSLALLVLALVTVPIGRWLDHHDARPLMAAACVAGSLLVLAWSRVETLFGLYAVWVGLGLVLGAALYEPAAALMVRWYPDRARSGILAVTVVGGLASTMFMPVTDLLVQTLQWRDALVALAVLLALLTWPVQALLLRARPPDDVHRVGARGHGAVRARAGRASEEERQQVAAARRRALRGTTFWLITGGFVAANLAVAVVSVHLVALLREAGHSTGFAAMAAGGLGLLSVIGRLVVTVLTRRWSTAMVTAGVFGMQVVGIPILALWGESPAGAVVFVLLFGVGFGMTAIARPVLLVQAFGGTAFASLSGVSAFGAWIARAVGPVGASGVYALSGSYDAVLYAVALACLLASVAIGLIRRTTPAEVEDTAAGGSNTRPPR